VAAKVDNEPCVTWLGPRSAGHYVKMVHNGIEYGLMQLIAETYDLMKRGLGLNDDELSDVYRAWNTGELNGYLLEITSHIFPKADEQTGKRLIDMILDEAKQKGTGMWLHRMQWTCKCPFRRLTWRWRCAICPHSKTSARKPVASCRDLSPVLQAIARCSSANCGVPFTRE
jgi:6-phosphogluconate dehydrogenase